MKLTLLQKPGRVHIDDFKTALQNQLSTLESGISATAVFAGFTKSGWAQVNLGGMDYEILKEMISRELGLAPVALSEVERYGNYSGLILGRQEDHVDVDIGVEQPTVVPVSISLSTLRSQLCDGSQTPINDIIDDYCLQSDSKISVRITRLGQGLRRIEGWIADAQIALFAQSIRSMLQSVHVSNCTKTQLDSALRKAGLTRDIVFIRNMTLTSHSVVCKFGTDAVGLIPKLGLILRKSELKPFIPDRIISRCKKW